MRRAHRRWALLAVGAALSATLVVAILLQLDGAEPSDRAAQGDRERGTAAGLPRLRTVLVRTGSGPVPRAPRPGTGRPKVAAGPARAGRPEYVDGQLLVKFEHDASRHAVSAALAEAGVDVEDRVDKIDVRVVDVPAPRTAEALAELRASPAVEYVERDVAMQMFDTIPNDSLWPGQWGPELVQAPRAWDSATGSATIVIAVLDTGVDHAHPDLQGATIPGYDFVNGDADPSDDEGHGTAAAGVMGARTNNGEGQAGLCWRCSLMPVKVLDGSGEGDTASVAAGIIWAADHGARVISMSLGGEGTTQTLSDAVEYAVGKGVLLVAAAGNSGSATPVYPAAYPQVLSVAGTNDDDGLYSWSNYGAWVKVAAPGCNTAPWIDAAYVNFCGTSSAAPLVSGLAGLALSAQPGATSAAVVQAIAGTAAPLPSAVEHGRVDAARALAALGAPAASPRAPPNSAPSADSVEGGRAYEGSLTARFRQRRFVHQVTGGGIAAELRFRGVRSLTFTIVDSDGTTVARVSGRSPLRLAEDLEAGRYALVVRSAARRKARFTLSVSPIDP